jgi:phosphoribosylglycinamide formyltransferase 1
MEVKRIAVLASGSGSNAQKIMEYFADNETIKVDCLLSNNPSAYALERATKMNVDTFVITREQFYHSEYVSDLFIRRDISLLVLAGFLWLVPEYLVNSFKIINIHPALLPSYGGKNMYGMNVHRAVIANREKFSGITIHYVNKNYDEGDIIFQAVCEISGSDTPESLAEKVHRLEHEHYPRIIDEILHAPE